MRFGGWKLERVERCPKEWEVYDGVKQRVRCELDRHHDGVCQAMFLVPMHMRVSLFDPANNTISSVHPDNYLVKV